MPRNGSGQYNLPYNWNDDKTNGIKVLASRMQAQDQDIATALTGSLAKDGQTPLTGDLDFNSNKAVDLADGTAAGDAVNVSQAQTGELEYYGVSTTTSGGTDGEDYTIAANATLAAYPIYTRFYFTSHYTCIDGPVARLDALADKTLVKSDGASGYTALVAGDIIADKEYIAIYNEDISSSQIIIENAEILNSVQAGETQSRTIASGVVAASSDYSSYTIDTESAAATDDLDTISGGVEGQVIFISNTDSARTVVVKNGTGNIINISGDISLENPNQEISLKYNGTSWIKQTAGQVIQVINSQYSSYASGTGTIPRDDTIPQKTEGNERMTCTITPVSSKNKLKIEVVAQLSNSGVTDLTAALFQDSTSGALCSGASTTPGGNSRAPISFTYYMEAGTTSATTFKVRVGGSGGTTYFNGFSGGRLYGGTMYSSITITEIQS